jgi:hypothetical protein
MCEYGGINDPQRYSKEELSAEQVELRIRNIIKVGRDEPLKLKIPMYENGSCPKVSVSFYSAITANFFLNNFTFLRSFPPCRHRNWAVLSAIPGRRSLLMTRTRRPRLPRDRRWRKRSQWRMKLQQQFLVAFVVLAGAFVG